MPLQNRVLPTGEIVASPMRGTFFGNRGGAHHDGDKRLTSPFVSRRWIVCVLSFKGRQRTIMAPNRYTELFFSDEVVAFAAGHRPCFECRCTAARAFIDAAGARNADALDARLHDERVGGKTGERKASRPFRRHSVPFATLPHGAMVLLGGTVFARHRGAFIAFGGPDAGGYAATLTDQLARDAAELERVAAVGGTVSQLTPPTTAAVLRAGYEPAFHPSAETALRFAAGQFL